MRRLFLASEGKHPKTLERLKKYIGGSFQGKKIVYIPTAANGEVFGSWNESNSLKTVLGLGAGVKVIELEATNADELKAELINTDILWMAGGMAGYLMYWIRRVELDKLLPHLLEKGMLYVGSSAGSWVCSKSLNVAEIFIGEEEKGASLIPGLGYLGFEIYAHYEDDLKPRIKSLWKDEYGELKPLRNGDVILVENDNITLLGEDIKI